MEILVETLLNISYLFPEPYTEILGGPNIYLEEGFTMNLTCLVRESPEPPQYIFWYQNEQVNIYIECFFIQIEFPIQG